MRQSNNPFVRQIEFIMFHESEIRNAVEAVRKDPRHVFTGNSSKKTHSDPTADQAAINVTEIKSVTLLSGGTVAYPERWIRIIDLAYTRLNSDERNIMSARYWHNEHYVKVMHRLHISKSTYQMHLERVRQWLTIAAVQEGLIKII